MHYADGICFFKAAQVTDNVVWVERVSLNVDAMMAGMELIVHWHLREIAKMEKITTKVSVLYSCYS